MSTFTVMCPVCGKDQPRVPCCEKCQAAYDRLPAHVRRFCAWALGKIAAARMDAEPREVRS